MNPLRRSSRSGVWGRTGRRLCGARLRPGDVRCGDTAAAPAYTSAKIKHLDYPRACRQKPCHARRGYLTTHLTTTHAAPTPPPIRPRSDTHTQPANPPSPRGIEGDKTLPPELPILAGSAALS